MTGVGEGRGADRRTEKIPGQSGKRLHFTSPLFPSAAQRLSGTERTDFTCSERNYVSLGEFSPAHGSHFISSPSEPRFPLSRLHTWWYKWWSLNPTRPGRTTGTVLREEPRVCASKTKKKTRWVRLWVRLVADLSFLTLYLSFASFLKCTINL